MHTNEQTFVNILRHLVKLTIANVFDHLLYNIFWGKNAVLFTFMTTDLKKCGPKSTLNHLTQFEVMGHNVKCRLCNLQVPYGLTDRKPDFHQSAQSLIHGMETVSCLSLNIYNTVLLCQSWNINPVHTVHSATCSPCRNCCVTGAKISHIAPWNIVKYHH